MYQPLTKCPVCKNDLVITRQHCPHCDTTIEGQFSYAGNPFSILTPEQLQFIVTFVRCEGRFNRMEEEMNLSYPTLRSRLGDVLRALGFEPSRDDESARPSTEERRKILEDLDQGLITWEQAQRRLSGQKDEEMTAVETPTVEVKKPKKK